ncbi:MAG: hypothetical protein ABIP50_00050 [Candidatus Saccharimonadales bacterium]
MTMNGELPIIHFDDRSTFRAWLSEYHNRSAGLWVQLNKKRPGLHGLTFQDVLEETLCFGWSESVRRSHDEHSYIQKCTPRRMPGTQSVRNRLLVERLIADGLMTPAGLAVFGR